MSAVSDIMESKPMYFTDSQIYHDRILIVGEEKFYVVSGVLSQWSNYFRVMFEGNFKEADKNEIELKEIDPEHFEEFLKILYDSSFANINAKLLIPLIDLSFFFLAPKVLDACKNFVDKSLATFPGPQILRLLDKACEKSIKELKEKIVNYLKNEDVVKNFKYVEVVKCAVEHKLNDLKDWLGNYLADKVTVVNCPFWLDYGTVNEMPTLKAAIINKMALWDQPELYDQKNLLNRPKPLIEEDSIIGLMEYAFKYDIDILKAILRKRIFHLSRNTGIYATNADTTVNVNPFMEKNFEKIFYMPKEIREFIITSAIRTG